nr:condensation domain-containing protein [uncultured bacterium]
MSRENVEDLYPLTPLQQGLLFHTLYEPEAGVYVEQLSCLLRGRLDARAFERAWRQTIARHAVLRTAFVAKDLAEPLQAVLKSVKLLCAQEDWRVLPRAEQEERLTAYLEEDRRRGFDLSKAPLMRLALVRLADNEYRFVWTYHHLLLDGWCVPLVLREVFAFYEAAARGREVSLERHRPFRDYIAWLRRQDVSQAESFWRETLKGFDAPTPLGVDRAEGDLTKRSAGLDPYGEQKDSLSAETTSALQLLARRHQLTLNTLVQGAWALLLSRYSGQRDVIFGVTVSGRPAELAGVETMVGPFINTLPLRVRAEPREPLVLWLKRLQAQQVEMRQYEYSPLVEVQGWSDVPRGVPLFESLLVFENYPADASLFDLPEGLSVGEIRKIEKTNYPLTLLAGPAAELLLHLSYDRRRFADAVVSRVLGHLKTLLAAFASDPDARLGDLPLLAADERRQLIVGWNDTAREYPQGSATLHELFERQAAATPDASAVVCEDGELTYGELNARADRLAHRLRSLGVGPESRVGVLMERSAAMVVALLGALKAGGAYVPLEPAYPRERLAFMAEDARVKVLLAQQHLRVMVDGLGMRGCDMLYLDAAGQTGDGDGACATDIAENARAVVGGDNLAYVIYTSGSTGRPKGAMNTHAGVVNRLLWMQDEYRLTADDRVLQKTPCGFDVSVWEFFWPLITGASRAGAARRAQGCGLSHAPDRTQGNHDVALRPLDVASLPVGAGT